MEKQHGYTLLELAVVITIIGLIVGTTIVGQSMIRVAQVNTVIDDLARYSEAVTLFQDKFHALPGDFEAAESLWGTASGGCPLGARSGKQTCNGNGNGFIDWGPSGGFGDNAANNYELYTTWQHLANAGMVEGVYTGLSGPSTGRHSIPGVNVPLSRVSKAGFTMWTVAGYSDAGSWTNISAMYGTYIFFGISADFGTHETYGPALSPKEAFSIDSKLDDGRPGTGVLISWPAGYSPKCASTGNAQTAIYLVSNTIGCQLIFHTNASGP